MAWYYYLLLALAIYLLYRFVRWLVRPKRYVRKDGWSSGYDSASDSFVVSPFSDDAYDALDGHGFNGFDGGHSGGGGADSSWDSDSDSDSGDSDCSSDD